MGEIRIVSPGKTRTVSAVRLFFVKEKNYFVFYCIFLTMEGIC